MMLLSEISKSFCVVLTQDCINCLIRSAVDARVPFWNRKLSTTEISNKMIILVTLREVLVAKYPWPSIIYFSSVFEYLSSLT